MGEGCPVLRSEHLPEQPPCWAWAKRANESIRGSWELGITDGAGTERAGMMHAAKKCMARRLSEIGMNRRFGSELEAPQRGCRYGGAHA